MLAGDLEGSSKISSSKRRSGYLSFLELSPEFLSLTFRNTRGQAEGAAPPSSSNPFRGSGHTLGDDDTPSAVAGQSTSATQPGSSSTSAAGAARTQAGASSLLQSLLSGFRGAGAQPEEEEEDEEEVTRRLTFWRDGFSIEDGELYRYDEPGNKDLLEAIQAGRAPPSLFGVRFNQPLRLEVAQRTNEDYKQPPKVHKPFEGGGNRLGSPSPEVRGSGSATPSGSGSMPGGILQGGSVGHAPTTSASAPTFELDNSKPTTSIQLRLGDGAKLVAKVNLTHTIADLRNYVSA